MVAVTLFLGLAIMHLPPGKYKEVILQVGTALAMLVPLLGESVAERTRMTGHGLVLLLKVWDYIVEHREDPTKKKRKYRLTEILFYFFHPMSGLPAERLATVRDVQTTLLDAVGKFTVLGAFILMGYVVPPMVTDIYLIKSFLGLVYFYLTIDFFITNRLRVFDVANRMVHFTNV